MRLVDLNPRFLSAGGEGIYHRDPSTGALVPAPRREGVGIMFDCPCGCPNPCYVPFRNPVDGGEPLESGNPRWDRTGDTFETLTLSPSILRSLPHGCGWHGWIRNGEIIQCG